MRLPMAHPREDPCFGAEPPIDPMNSQPRCCLANDVACGAHAQMGASVCEPQAGQRAARLGPRVLAAPLRRAMVCTRAAAGPRWSVDRPSTAGEPEGGRRLPWRRGPAPPLLIFLGPRPDAGCQL